jgi:hypothetical protein
MHLFVVLKHKLCEMLSFSFCLALSAQAALPREQMSKEAIQL